MSARPLFVLSTGCLFHLPLGRVGGICAQAGFAGVEFIMTEACLRNPALAGPVLEDLLAPAHVVSVHAPFRGIASFGGLVGSWQAAVDLANVLPACRAVTFHPPGMGLTDMLGGLWLKSAEQPGKLLGARQDLRLCLETMPWSRTSPFARSQVDKLSATCLQKGLHLTFDTCHVGLSTRDMVPQLLGLPDGLLANVHFSDASGVTEHLWPGEGQLPLDEVLSALVEYGYDGLFTLEVTPQAFGRMSDAEIVDRLAALRERIESWWEPAREAV